MDTRRIVFINRPTVSRHLVDRGFDEQRRALIPQVEAYIRHMDFFNADQVAVEFFSTGISALVCLLTAGGERYVLKIPVRAADARLESVFLKAWAGIGVAVPKVIENGSRQSHLLMHHVPAQTLDREYSEHELIRNRAFFRMGKTIRCMHSVPAIGYGRPSSGLIGEHDSFEGWLRQSHLARNELVRTRRCGLLSEEVHGSVDEAARILVEHALADPQSSYCHWDFGPHNLLSTEPFTVIDPDARFCIPYVDLGRSIIKTIGVGCFQAEAVNQIISGYFADDPVGPKRQVLFAATLLAGYSTMPYLVDRGMTREAAAVRDYLAAQNGTARQV